MCPGIDLTLYLVRALVKATPGGSWVDYEWQGKKKYTYAKKTKSGLIVASGYYE